MASDLSVEAREILRGLLAGKSLDEVAVPGSPARAEIEAHLVASLSGEGADAGAGRASEAAAGRQERPVPGCAIAYSDGASRGNPGPAAYGIRILAPDETELMAEGKAIGRATNNVAEYRGVIAVLERARDLGIEELELRLDSELIVKQIDGAYRVKHPALVELKSVVDDLLRRFRSVRVRHIPREQNREADLLANEALDAV